MKVLVAARTPYEAKRARGAPPDHPLLAFDVLGRVPGALSTTIDQDRLDPESGLPARCPQPSFERPLRKRRARS
jgi:hypothetical protein